MPSLEEIRRRQKQQRKQSVGSAVTKPVPVKPQQPAVQVEERPAVKVMPMPAAINIEQPPVTAFRATDIQNSSTTSNWILMQRCDSVEYVPAAMSDEEDEFADDSIDDYDLAPAIILVSERYQQDIQSDGRSKHKRSVDDMDLEDLNQQQGVLSNSALPLKSLSQVSAEVISSTATAKQSTVKLQWHQLATKLVLYSKEPLVQLQNQLEQPHCWYYSQPCKAIVPLQATETDLWLRVWDEVVKHQQVFVVHQEITLALTNDKWLISNANAFVVRALLKLADDRQTELAIRNSSGRDLTVSVAYEQQQHKLLLSQLGKHKFCIGGFRDTRHLVSAFVEQLCTKPVSFYGRPSTELPHLVSSTRFQSAVNLCASVRDTGVVKRTSGDLASVYSLTVEGVMLPQQVGEIVGRAQTAKIECAVAAWNNNVK